MTIQPEHSAKAQNYITRIHKALDAALASAIAAGDTRVLDLADSRYVIFSDHHRGARNGADDFRWSEQAYNAALAYYLHMGYTLVVLGDVEELWEETPTAVVRAHQHGLELEAQFHRRGRYVRIWGNHDDEWQYEDSVRRHLGDIYDTPLLRAHESMRFIVTEGTETLGTLFMLHGHQGDTWSNTLAWIMRPFIRYIWRTFQHLTRISINTPATSWKLRRRCSQAMYAWAARQQKLVLITGHTHAPVFESHSHTAQPTADITEREERTSKSEVDRKKRGLLSAQQDPNIPPQEAHISMAKPCYFNTGCCCYINGDIIGIEIANSQIRLVRWPNKTGKPQPHILEEANLRDVFSAC